jgi:ABC-type multidrug transport system fused ATPase/permease subunit
MATIKNADRIYVLHDGKIVQCGSHEELIKQEGHYMKILKLQELKEGGEIIQWSQ